MVGTVVGSVVGSVVGAAVVSGTVEGVVAGTLFAPQPHSSSVSASIRAITLFMIFFLSCW
ncbi:MAG TPA: hypothetical protein DDY90_03400 [Clostridiales bacterium]|nr:hypothetical protein [Clostridiales bacterium]HBK25780.1 hypothetical protein [Clostridiales bacterium]HCP71633.1 hypothetical protein [Clostridiales bacterium]